jgi:hypothetical protein
MIQPYYADPTDSVKEALTPADWVRAQPMEFFMDCGNIGVADLMMTVLRAIETYAYDLRVPMDDILIRDFTWRGEIPDVELILTLDTK